MLKALREISRGPLRNPKRVLRGERKLIKIEEAQIAKTVGRAEFALPNDYLYTVLGHACFRVVPVLGTLIWERFRGFQSTYSMLIPHSLRLNPCEE